jgi:hypothetical protein
MSPFYEVPPESEEEFLALIERAQQVYGAHALGWRIGRSVKTPGLWSEHGPVFREEADHEKAVAELGGDPLGRFKLERHPDAGNSPVFGMIERWPDDFDLVFETGDPHADFSPSRPPIDTSEMTPAMRSGQALAAALVARLNPVLPGHFSLAASTEVVEVHEGGTLVTWMSFVDGDPEDAVQAFIDQLQSDVSEITTEPWPRDPSGSYEFHEPFVEVRDGAIHVIFGSDDDPVLVLEPIPLSDIGR